MASLEELQRLNAEMASLARAGVPLEVGLSHLSQTLPRRLGELAGRLSSRLQEGRPLAEALHLEGRHVSPTYVAVVEAGLEADRLPAALDALADYGAVVQDTRRRVLLALLYPGLVAIVAYALFWLYVVLVIPTIVTTLEFSPEKTPPLAKTLRAIWETSGVWGPLVPIALVLLLMFASRLLASASSLRGRVGGRILGGAWFPGVTGMYADLDRSQTSALLGMLLKHGIPLPRALRLTAAATRSSNLSSACSRLADGIEQGRPLRSLVEHDVRLPPLMARLFASGDATGHLSDALSQASLIYRRRALHRADWLRMFLPPVMVVLIGGGVTLLYALSLIIPLKTMWIGV